MLDKIDQQLLYTLEKDSRQSLVKIAHAIKKPTSVMAYRLERLQRKGIITGFRYIADQVLLGRFSFGILLQFKDITPAEEKKIINQLKQTKKVSWVVPLLSTWDLLVIVIDDGLPSFLDVLKVIFSFSGQFVKDYAFYTDYAGTIMQHKYLYDHGTLIITEYGKKGNVSLKNSELAVYDAMKQQPRTTLIELSRQLKKSYETVSDKYNLLVRQGILLRCVPKLDIAYFGYKEYFCFLSLMPNMPRMEEFLMFCRKHPLVIRYAHCLGNFNLILTIHAKNEEEMNNLLYTIKREYGDILARYELAVRR